MTSSHAPRWIALCLCLVGLPHAAAAQQASMTIEPVDNGFVVAPDFKYTKIDGSSASLAGVYGGWVYDHTLVFGAAGYWQTNGDRNRAQVSYGGALVKWLVQDTEPVGFSLSALIGGGDARLPTNVTFTSFDSRNTVPPHLVTTQGQVLLRDQFFVFEPGADVNVRLAPHARLAVGVGYRVIGRAFNDAESRLRGASGTVSVQFFTAPETRAARRP
jgi:hypothetical protein